MRSYHKNEHNHFAVLPLLLSFTFHAVLFAGPVDPETKTFYVKTRNSQLLNEVILSPQGHGITSVSAKFIGKGPLTANLYESIDKINEIQLGDVDNDGFEDLLILSYTKLYLIKGRQEGFDGNRAVIHTTPLYHPQVKIAEGVTLRKIKKTSPLRYVSEQHRLCGRMAIGDLNNDGKNEIVVAKRYFYARESQTPYGLFYTAVDVMVWRAGAFELVDRIIRYAGAREGVFILDVDQDSKMELVVGDASAIYFYEWATSTEKSNEKVDKHWMAGSLASNLIPDSYIHFHGTPGEQRYGLFVSDGNVLLAKCLVWGKSLVGKVGDVFVYHLDPQTLKFGGKKIGNKKMYSIAEFKLVSNPISIIEKAIDEAEGKTNLTNMRGLELGTSRHTGKMQIIIYLEDETRIHVFE